MATTTASTNQSLQDVPRVCGRVAGVSFELSCSEPGLASYAQAHLAASLDHGSEDPSVQSTLRWHEGMPPRGRQVWPDADRVDRDLYVSGNRLAWFRVDDLRDLFISMTWEQGRLQVEGDFYFRLGNTPWSDRLRRLRQGRQAQALRRRRLPTLVSYLVYYPCWWWAEERQGFHPIHAAGVSTPRGVVLLAGASGVGKSTLATALAAAPDAQLLGDSFVLHHGDEVRAVHEPILLDAWSRAWLGPRGDQLQAMQQPYMLQRSGYQMHPEHRAEKGRAVLLLFPRRSKQPYLRAISPQLAQQRLSAGDLIINDLRRYFAFAAVLEHLAPRGLVARREAHLGQLAASVPAYELGLTEDLSCDASVQRVRDLLDQLPPAEVRA